MRSFIDLHIHSRYSRATSPALTPANLSRWAEIKGLALLGTGDLTHPAWRRELAESLERRDDGFYSLRGRQDGPRFVPTGEISAIYKQDGRTRKIHLVVICPDLEAAEAFSQILGRRGNLEADGRPILGLTARQILDMALTSHPEIKIAPAHIWTPWFSLFGSQSGFDHLEECFGDLSGHITALETGLSSDPDMNRLVSALDSRALISSSDAHSLEKLGREATVINGPLTWAALAEALAGGPALGGTVEFFPEEGKYHLDGHADCGPALTPAETKALNGLCPVCGRPLTIGVLNRVLQLADRESPGGPRRPDRHILPLAELLGQIYGQGPASRRPAAAYERLTAELGGELPLLLEAPLDDLEAAGGPLLRLGADRMRRGLVETQGGFDGRYGQVTVIGPAERAALSGQGRLFEGGAPAKRRPALTAPDAAKTGVAGAGAAKTGAAGAGAAGADSPEHKKPENPEKHKKNEKNEKNIPLVLSRGDPLLDGLDENQARAVASPAAFLAVVAGPGSGKTRTLVHRAAWLLREGLAAPETTLLTAFTRKAAEDLAPRLATALPFRSESARVRLSTLHGLAYGFLKAEKPDWELAPESFLAELCKKAGRLAALSPAAFASLASLSKNRNLPPPPDLAQAFNAYQAGLERRNYWDFDDLVLLASPPAPGPFQTILADEFQDLSPAQLDFLKRLSAKPDRPGALTVIGDPDQSIYGFRGADPQPAARLAAGWGEPETITLTANYRSVNSIMKAAESLWPRRSRPRRRAARGEAGAKIVRATLGTARAEAAYVTGRITAHLGLLKLGRASSARADAEFMPGLNLADIAILFRLRDLGRPLAEALTAAGLPWQMSGEEPLTATDRLDWQADKISLLTMHAAKGLEFRLVFIIGAEDDICPYRRAAPEPKTTKNTKNIKTDEDEERRLFYVALTRAKDRLYLTRAAKRRLHGRSLSGEPSPFWTALPDRLCLDLRPAARRPAPRRATLFDRLEPADRI